MEQGDSDFVDNNRVIDSEALVETEKIKENPDEPLISDAKDNELSADESVAEDGEDYSEARWEHLKKQTEEIKSLAIGCPNLNSDGVAETITDLLDDIQNYLNSIDVPKPKNFKFVDNKMKEVNKLVGGAIEEFIKRQRAQKNGAVAFLNITMKILALSGAVLVGGIILQYFKPELVYEDIF